MKEEDYQQLQEIEADLAEVEAELALVKVKVELAEFELAISQGKYISREVVEKQEAEQIAAIKQVLRVLPSTLPILLENQSEAKMRTFFRREVEYCVKIFSEGIETAAQEGEHGGSPAHTAAISQPGHEILQGKSNRGLTAIF